MRRKDREMDRDFALMVLDRCEWATLAMASEDGTPYCVPVNIVREGAFLYIHSAKTGEKVEYLRHNPRVCLTAVGSSRISSDAFTTEYECAVVHGQAEEITAPDEKKEALRLLCQRLVPAQMDHFEEELAASLNRTGVWRISLDMVTGKRNKPSDSPR